MRPYNPTYPLPEEFAAKLKAEFPYSTSNGLIAAAREVGWSLRSMAEVCGVTPEAIRLRSRQANMAYAQTRLPEVPSLPPKQGRPERFVPKRYWDIPADQAWELKTLADVARNVNGGMRSDDPRREASVELAKRFYDLTQEGYGVASIARAAGVTRTAVSMRLMRYGYIPSYPSMINQDYQGHATFERPDTEEGL